MRARSVIGLAACVLAGFASGAGAEPGGDGAGAGTKRARVYFRAGVVHVAPQAESSEVELTDVMGVAELAIEEGPVEGSGVEVSSATVPAAIVGVVLPWLDGRLAIETVLGLPFTVKFRATGTLANESLAPVAFGFIPTGIPALGPELGEAKVVPPIVTAVYRHRSARLGPVRPFAGAGIGMLFAYNARVTNPVLTAVREPELSISRATGLVLQGGVEARLWRNVHARLDLKYAAFMTSRATIEGIAVETTIPLLSMVEVGNAHMDVTVNPLIVQVGVGADF